MKIAIIPARGGSKRIVRKNIRPFRGKPILAWSIAAATQSAVFDVVMVSTDDPEIAEIATSFGAVVPFLRSPETSSDHATTADVLSEVLAQYQAQGQTFSEGCCLYPTAPFATGADLRQGYDILMREGFETVFPVAPFGYTIWRSLKRDASGRVALNWPQNRNVRSQDLPTAYHDAGQWYWFKVEAFMRTRVLMGDNAGSVVLPDTRVQDIDTEDDWILAELKHERLWP